MAVQTLEDRLKELVADELTIENEDEITANANLVDDLGADSLDQLQLCMRLEEEFSIEIPDEEAEELKTFGDVVKYVKEHTEEQ